MPSRHRQPVELAALNAESRPDGADLDAEPHQEAPAAALRRPVVAEPPAALDAAALGAPARAARAQRATKRPAGQAWDGWPAAPAARSSVRFSSCPGKQTLGSSTVHGTNFPDCLVGSMPKINRFSTGTAQVDMWPLLPIFRPQVKTAWEKGCVGIEYLPHPSKVAFGKRPGWELLILHTSQPSMPERMISIAFFVLIQRLPKPGATLSAANSETTYAVPGPNASALASTPSGPPRMGESARTPIGSLPVVCPYSYRTPTAGQRR